MTPKFFYRLSFAAALLSSAALADTLEGPFGIYKGMGAGDLQIVETLENYTFALTQPPEPHPSFERYLVMIAPGTGVCKVAAISPAFQADAFGDKVKAEFAELNEQLSEIYGKPEMFDLLKPGALWDEPRYWSMSINQNERVLVAAWATDAKKPRVKDDITAIMLEVVGAGHDATRIKLQYEFYNADDCEAAVKAKGKGSL